MSAKRTSADSRQLAANGAAVNGAASPAPSRITVGYIRLTREESLKKGLSAAAQRADIAEYARRAGLPELRVVEEPEAVGGDVPFGKRKAARQLIKDIEADHVAHLVVRDLDRISRDVLLWLELVTLCQDHNVTIHTLSGALPTTSPTDKFSTIVRAAAAQLERDQVSDRVRRVKRELARQGRHVGGPPCYGYTSQARRRSELVAAGMPLEQACAQAETELPLVRHLYIDRAEARVVKVIFDLYARKRWGVRRVANELNRLGFRRRSGLPWHQDKVRKVITNPVLAGWMPHDGAFFDSPRGPRTPKHRQDFYDGKHEAIIPKDFWLQAQEIRKSHVSPSRNRGDASFANRRYPLVGVLRCKCGEKMRLGSTRPNLAYGYFVCARRYYYGPDAVNGCSFPRLNSERLGAGFWAKLSDMVSSPALVNRVYEAAQQLLQEQEDSAVDGDDAQQQLAKVTSDLAKWYERHDAAKTEAEKEAAWARIVQLTERRKKLATDAQAKPVKATVAASRDITRDQVAGYLKDLAATIGKAGDRGKALVQSLVEHHGLVVQMRDEQTMLIQLALTPPGSDTASAEHAVRLEGDARMAKDRISGWVDEHQGRLCKECGKLIQVERRHFWRGVPEYHHGCWMRECTRRRLAAVNGAYYTGGQAARRLGIGQTTLNRWIKSGKAPKPVKVEKRMNLFDRGEIDCLARQSSAAR